MTAALTTDEIMRLAPVIPVLIIEDIADAVPLGRALVAGGLPVLEVTLRTPPPWTASSAWPARSRAAWSAPAPCSPPPRGAPSPRSAAGSASAPA